MATEEVPPSCAYVSYIYPATILYGWGAEKKALILEILIHSLRSSKTGSRDKMRLALCLWR